LTGRKDPDGVYEEILTKGKYDRAEAQGKIFHLFACNCGYLGASPGLGADLVTNGAKAFFGYSAPFVLDVKFQAAFCSCDIEIDLALLGGDTADQAYDKARNRYERTIRNLRDNNQEYEAAARLDGNLNILVAPSISPAYGDKGATL
jgi:hypothetical protein